MKKVLIADDEPEIVEMLEAILQTSGYQVFSVMNGSDLPRKVQEVKPDILLLDVLLPGIDGYSLQMRFAQEEETKDMPVIVITALPAARALFEKFPQVKLFLSKPFDPMELIEKIREITGNPARKEHKNA